MKSNAKLIFQCFFTWACYVKYLINHHVLIVLYIRGPQAFWHQGPVPWKITFQLTGWKGLVQVIIWAMMGDWGAADEVYLVCPPLTSCCVAWFLTGREPILFCSSGIGDPGYTVSVASWSCLVTQLFSGITSVTDLKLESPLLKSSWFILRDKCWVKGKVALLRKSAILGRTWTHVPKNKLPSASQGGQKLLKGSFRGVSMEGGGHMKKQLSQRWQSSWKWSLVVWPASPLLI